MRYQSDYESVHQRDHALPTLVDESNSTSVATDRTICRDYMVPTVDCNRVDNTIYRDRAMYRQEHEMPMVQHTERPSTYYSVPVGRNSTTGEMIYKTVHHDGDRHIYHQDGRTNNETNTYPNYLQQAPVGRNGTIGEMIDKTVYQGVDRPICQQDGRMSYERNTYQNYDDSVYTQNSRLQRQREKMESNLHITMVSNFPHLTGKKTGKFGLADLRRLQTEITI